MALVVACDVNNPLLGARGAVRAFGPQKGASPDTVEQLECAMERYAAMFAAAVPAHDAVAAANQPGAGAAGGLGYALEVALGARLVSGIELVMDSTGFLERLRDVDAVVTGEGCLDQSSFEGKVLSGVLEAARRRGLPVHVVAGWTPLSEREWRSRGIASVTCLADVATSRDDAQQRAQALLAEAARELVRKLGLY
jgi:glycerate kinase